MKRPELEQVIRAAGSIAGDSEIVIIGRQGILGRFPGAPMAPLASAEAGVSPRHPPEPADLIDGGIGEGSAFHERDGSCVQGVDEGTAVSPSGWRDRVVRVSDPNTLRVVGLCLAVHDPAKNVARRGKEPDVTRERAKPA